MLTQICDKAGIRASFYEQSDEPTGTRACLATSDQLETSVLSIAAGNAYSKERHLDEGKPGLLRLNPWLQNASSFQVPFGHKSARPSTTSALATSSQVLLTT